MEWKVRFVDYPEQFKKWGKEMMKEIENHLKDIKK